jgi:hypothetical protein
MPKLQELVKAIGCLIFKLCNARIEKETNGIDESPVFNLVGSADFAVAVQNVHSGVRGDVDIVWMAGEDDGHAFADIVPVFSYCHLTDMDP